MKLSRRMMRAMFWVTLIFWLLSATIPYIYLFAINPIGLKYRADITNEMLEKAKHELIDVYDWSSVSLTQTVMANWAGSAWFTWIIPLAIKKRQ